MPEPAASIEHGLDWYYTHPDDYYVTLLEAALSVEALDTPAWLAYEINHPAHHIETGSRLDVVSYSNIEGGRGLMTATTTKTIPLLFPAGQK